jgi:hypothetical protein
MEELVKYLSIKFQREIKRINYSYGSLVFEYNEKRILKLEKYPKNSYQIALYNYLKEKGNELPIAKVYSVGEIIVPKNIVKKVNKNWVDNRKYVFQIMEKVNIPDSLIYDLEYISESFYDINDYYGNTLISNDVLSSIPLLFDLKLYNKIGIIIKYFQEKEDKKYLTLLLKVIDIVKKLREYNIEWSDIHSRQFGYNSKGKLVAFDLDSLKKIEDKKLFNLKNSIKEMKENTYIVTTYKSFSLIKENIQEIIDLIKNDKKIYVKYIYGYNEHDPNKSYLPVDIDNKGNISLDIDGKIYYTKIEWVERVEESFRNYNIDQDMVEPIKDEQKDKLKHTWEEDKEFTNLLKDHGGMKKLIKKIKKNKNIDYSECEDEQELYISLKNDNML